MRDIDFLPAKYRERGVQRRSQYWRIVVMVVFGGLICAAVIGQYGIRRQVEQQALVARLQHAATMSEVSRLARIEQDSKPVRIKAELLTFLRHPWPVTQIISRVLAPLPDSITLSKLQVDREQVATAQAVPAPSPEAAAQTVATMLPAERDLQRLRREADGSQVVVTIEGVAEDESALHVYLGKLATIGLFAKEELTSIESEGLEQGVGSRFHARLVVRPGYGLSGGPTAPTSKDSPKSSRATEKVAGRLVP